MTSTIKHRLLPGSSSQHAFEYDTTPSQGHFAAQELIQQLIKTNPRDVPAICAFPPNVDKNVWIVEHLRQFLLELNLLCVSLNEFCSKETCPTMNATKDEYLCAAHPQPKECCAIDYIVHQINGFAALLHSNEYFPSRLRVPPKSIATVQSITRRLYRVFAHTYYRHENVFWDFELKTFLCTRFKYFMLSTKLMTVDQFIIPQKELSLTLQTKLQEKSQDK